MDILDRARDIINNAASHPDPEGALEALEKSAGPEDRAMFPSLWEALVLKMNEAPIDDNDPG
jgi:hypothetical protein